MVQKPRWLSIVTVGLVAAFVLTACTPAAPATPAPATVAPVVTPAPATPAPGTPEPGTPEPATPEPGTPEPATPAPIGTPYPEPLAQPVDPATIAEVFPNYGEEIDCAAGTWNGLPYTGNLKSLTAPNPQTVVFTFCNPDVAFLSKIAFSVFAINDSDWLIAHTADNSHLETLNGTGAFKFEAWQRGSEIDYSRFDDYWGTKAVPATGVLQFSAESAARLQALQAGTVDGITLVGPDDFATVEADANLKLQPSGGLNTLYLGMNHDYEPWSNPAVRQALKIGIDRQRIVDEFLPPGSEVATHFTPCSIPFACEGDPWPDTDIAAARQMITDIFGEAGLTTTLAYRPPARGYIPLPAETAADFQAQLAAINIHAALDEQESATFITNSNTGKLEGLFLLGWGADYPDITNFLDFHFGAGCAAGFGECYPAVADPLTIGGQTSDQATREQAYSDANNALIAEVPMVPISHAGFANAYLADVENQQISPLSTELLFLMTPSASHGEQLIFMQTGEPGSLYCADQTDGEALRACEQSMESLYGFEANGTAAIPSLATDCSSNEDLTVWTCALREGVTFHDGATFEAKDVLVSLSAQWDALSSLHVGLSGTFTYWPGLWGGFLNPPAPCGIEGQPVCEE
ncbi:MAG: ABC transporter substrate-binding protein [Chloroflexota bacterium]